MNEKDKLLTIGQFASMHGINKKTLMWYDEVGLFKPASINPENGYRFYTYRQSPILETILLLRESDVSIEEIKAFMENRSAENLKFLLEEKMESLERSIIHLKAIKKTLGKYHQNMSTLLNMDLTEISIVEKEKRCLITIDIQEDTSFEEEVELVTAETEKYKLGRLHDANYGSMIPATSLEEGDFENYTKIFIEIPFLTEQNEHPQGKSSLHIQPGGRYLRAFHKGDWDGIPLRYQQILAYASGHGLKLAGYSYEMGINEIVVDRIEDYIVQIEIPIRI